ncbi:ESX secretion-associated protein EspG [Mycolicibacterium aichiense]|uniref:ESX-2 secretion-associated protein EspG2 n=1 Tax=Mycolicibacterium aichiense TaxID=1799 RepID=A0AAD1HHA4_9MYCO|nr:ESX secretion-associated protein EspG [Mycolicibacterium aichiense]MCV7020780.1 ESX secretion-associated protein EspG [Mycolicibacterium aichiense]BBX05347.1 ESX-2 secretion-associated protein EspG2 [Mycolicibacterium aichiense]STZ25301.1 Putative ESX-2 secretion-associated protein EspG2 [Mycolicibacterium aichiense]
MLTTTVDGLWVLQVLSGIEVVAPELGLRPHLPSVETAQMALAHPIADELRAAGVINDAGGVDEAVLEWLTVLSRRDIALVIYAQTPAQDIEPERVLLARFAQWWVALERNGILVRLSGVGTASSEESAGMLINSQIERLCGEMKPASLRPVTINVPELLAAVHDQASLRSFLLDRRFDSDQVTMLTMAADTDRSAQASVVAIQSGMPSGPARSHIEKGAVTILDTPQGRLVSEHVTRAGKSWMIISPGSAANIASAVLKMVRRLPAEDEWYSHRKVV